MPPLEQLGVVTSHSGVLIFIDTGYLRLWSHQQTPEMPDGVLADDESTAKASSFVDLHLVGKHAEQAGYLLGMSWHPSYVYDQPQVNPELEEKFETLVLKHHLDASFEVISPRIPHRRRADLALQHGQGAGEVQFHGIMAVVIGGIPRNQTIRVLGERCEEPNTDRWRRIIVECSPNKMVFRSLEVGAIAVDYARILVADLDALGIWKHDESLDALSDYLFWGRDADLVAAAFNAPKLGDNEFGWLNLAADAAEENGVAVEEYRDKHSLKIAVDYRPHSHHWQVMKDVRASRTESSTTELGGVQVCNFMTTWGDGFFVVHRDMGKDDELIQVRLEMEPEPSMPGLM